MAILTCKNLSVSYSGATVISGLDLSVNAGEYMCIVGENGTGKSSLVKALLGLIKHSGEITLGDGLKRTDIGYLPQQTDVQRDFPAGVWEVVLSGRLNKLGRRPFYSAADKKAADEALEKLSAQQLKGRSYRELSGGQQQRVLLARALCATNRLLLLDEPTAGLDPKVSEEMYELINKLNKKEKAAIIMVTHDLANAVRYADKLLVLSHNSHEICTPEKFIREYSKKLSRKDGAQK